MELSEERFFHRQLQECDLRCDRLVAYHVLCIFS